MLRINNRVINKLALYGIILWYLLPIITNRLGTLSVVVMYFVWAITCNMRILRNAVNGFISFLLWYAYMLIIFIIGLYSGVNCIYFFTMTMIFALPCVLFRYEVQYEEEYEESQFADKIRHLIIICFLVAAVNTIVVLLSYPMAAKIMAMGDSVAAEKAKYEALGCGGYNYIYSFMMACVALLLKRQNDTVKWKILTIVAVLLNAYVVVKSQYTIALLLIFVGFAIYFMYSLYTGGMTKLVLGFLLTLCLFSLFFFLPQIFMMASKLFSSSDGMSIRLQEVAEYLTTGTMGYNLGGRVDRYGWSFDLFLQHPILGAQFFGGGEYGQHSSVLDQLARYGIIGTVGYVIFCLKQFKFTRYYSDGRFLTVVYLQFLLFSFLNPTIYIYPVGMILLFAIPMISLNNI